MSFIDPTSETPLDRQYEEQPPATSYDDATAPGVGLDAETSSSYFNARGGLPALGGLGTYGASLGHAIPIPTGDYLPTTAVPVTAETDDDEGIFSSFRGQNEGLDETPDDQELPQPTADDDSPSSQTEAPVVDTSPPLPSPIVGRPWTMNTTNNDKTKEAYRTGYPDDPTPVVVNGEAFSSGAGATEVSEGGFDTIERVAQEDLQKLGPAARSRDMAEQLKVTLFDYTGGWMTALGDFAKEWDVPHNPYLQTNLDSLALQRFINNADKTLEAPIKHTLRGVRLIGSLAVVGAGLAFGAKEDFTINETMQPVDFFAISLAAIFIHAVNRLRKNRQAVRIETPRRDNRIKGLLADTVDTIDNYTRAKDREIEPREVSYVPHFSKKQRMQRYTNSSANIGRRAIRVEPHHMEPPQPTFVPHVTKKEHARYFGQKIGQVARRAGRGVYLGVLFAATGYALFVDKVSRGNYQPLDVLTTGPFAYTMAELGMYRPTHPDRPQPTTEDQAEDQDTSWKTFFGRFRHQQTAIDYSSAEIRAERETSLV